jgi:hypothetical protein
VTVIPIQQKHIMAAKIDTNLMKIYAGVENADLQILHHKRLEFLTVCPCDRSVFSMFVL